MNDDLHYDARMTFGNFYDQKFENLSSGNMSLEKGEYESCSFAGCDFSSADLSECRFMDTTFTECDFSNARLIDTSFQDVVFISCKMQGLFFPDCNSFGFDVTYQKCLLNYSVFQQMKLKRIQIMDSQLQSADFSGADLSEAVICCCDLKDATFEQTNLEKADLRGSRNYVIHPEVNRLKGARFSLPEVVGLLSRYGIKVDVG